MIDYQGSIEAQLWHALAISKAAAKSALEAALASGSWRDAPTTWVEVARRVAGRDDDALLAELLGELATTLRETSSKTNTELKEPELEAVLLVVGGLRWTKSARELDETIAWLARRASPGDASTVVAVLGSIWFNERDMPEEGSRFPDSAFALVEWLLASGTSELNMHGKVARADQPSAQQHRNAQQLRGGDLLFRIAEACNAEGRTQHLETALRYLYSSEYADAPWQQGSAEQVWHLTERGLQLGMDGQTVVDAVRFLRHGRHGERGRWLPLDGPERFPLAAAALARSVGEGLFNDWMTHEAVRHIFSCSPPPDVDARVAEPLLHAAINEQRQMNSPMRLLPDESKPPPPPTTRIAAWMGAVARSVGPLLDARLRDSQIARTLRAIAGDHPDIATAMLAGFADVLPAGDVAGDLARGSPANAALVDAIVAVLTSPRAAPRARAQADLTPLHATLTQMINKTWHKPVGGIDVGAVFRKVERVEFASLPDKRAVLVDGKTLRVDDEFPQRLFARGATDKAMLGSILYVAHEVGHIAQGFAGMDVVAQARAVGAETTILQIDLAADHTAALIARRLLPSVDLEHAKDVNSRGQLTFPVGNFHTEASRQRKAVRFASARFDLVARRHWRDAESEEGFFMLDFSPGGRTCLAFFSGLSLRLVSRPLALTDGQRNALVTAVDAGSVDARIARVDEVVATLADAAWQARATV